MTTFSGSVKKCLRRLATHGQHVPALRRTSWHHWGPHSVTCAECGPREWHLWRQSAGTQQRAAARSDWTAGKSKPFLTDSGLCELQQAIKLKTHSHENFGAGHARCGYVETADRGAIKHHARRYPIHAAMGVLVLRPVLGEPVVLGARVGAGVAASHDDGSLEL